MGLKNNNMKSGGYKKALLLTFVLISITTLGIAFHGEIYATQGAVGSESDSNPCAGKPNCGGGGSGNTNYDIHPYWVYFRIKDNAPTNGSWIIAQKDVSACKNTEGVYFSFKSNNANNDDVGTAQPTMPISNYDWQTTGSYQGNKSYVPMTYTTQQSVHKVKEDVYDQNVFEPEYILTKGQKAPNGIVHQPYTDEDKDTYTIKEDLNNNGSLNDVWSSDRDIPTDAILYISGRWDTHVRLIYFEGNKYYYNPDDKTRPYGEMCKVPTSIGYSANACRIYAYDGYYRPRPGDKEVPRGNYYAGNNGKRQVVATDPDIIRQYGKYIGQPNIEWASHVNVVWFCSGTANGRFTGKSDGTVTSKRATEDESKKTENDSTITRYFDGTRSDGARDNGTIYGKYDIKFTHTIKREIDSSNTNGRVKPVQEATIVTTVDGKVTKTVKWTNIRLDEGQSASKELTVKGVEVELNKTVTVCQTMTYQPIYEDGLPKGGTKTSKACVVIAQAIVMTTGSSSAVSNSIENNIKSPAKTGETKTVESWAGSSRTGNFTYSFYHKLKMEGIEGYTAELEYYITQTVDDGNPKAVPGGGTKSAPNKTKLNDVISGKDKYYTVFTSTGSWGEISEGGKTPTICQTIYFRPKTLSVKTFNGNATGDDKSWQWSKVCTLVNRLPSTTINLSASSEVYVDGKKNPTKPVISTKNVTATFAFDIDPDDRVLSTKYTIETLTYGASESKDWSKAKITANNKTATLPIKENSKITNSVTINPDTDDLYGKSIIVCERIKLNPDSYRINYKPKPGGEPGERVEDGITLNTSSSYYAERCATIAWPQKVMMDDGEITVSSSSSATIKDKNQAIYDASIGMYVMKQQKGNQQDKQSATVTYTHTLSRGKEYHTGGEKKEVDREKEKVTIRYRLDDDKTTFTSTSIANGSGDYSILPSVELKTNSTATVTSDKDQNYMNKNTRVTVSNVATPKTVCQAINYISSKYTLRGSYYVLNGKIYSEDTGMIDVEPPVSKYTVGRSNPACVTVMRPYNFKVDQIPVVSAPETVPQESKVDVQFEIDVVKNLDPNPDLIKDFSITDIPDATIQILKLTVTEPLTESDPTTGGTVSGDPCSHFTNALGAKAFCDVVKTETKTIAPSGPHDGSNASYYDTDNYSSYYNVNEDISGVPTTYKICYAIAVNPKSSGSNGYGTSPSDFDRSKWVVSDAACINIGKRPNVQVWGGSVFSSGGIRTAISRAKANGEDTSRTFGSWSDYMIVANGTNPNMASGATLISGMLNVTTCKYSPLTIANSTCTDSKELGKAHITSARSLERGIYDYYIKNRSDKYLDLRTTGLEGGSHVVSSNTINNASGTYPIIIYNNDSSHQNLYIKENIDIGFSGRTYSNNDIPQAIIYTPGNIYISPQVTRIDAWIIAGGEVRTCADADGTVVRTEKGRIEECEKVLTITGPVYAKKVLFDRTAKGDVDVSNPGKGSIAEPAELINLSPATYLFGYSESTNNAQPNVTYIHKLPVRY